MSRKRPRKWKEDESLDKDSLDKGSEEDVEEKEQEREEYDSFGFMKNKKQTAAVAGAFFVVGFLISWLVNPPLTAQVIGGGPTASLDEVGQNVVDYVNVNLLREGFTASIVETTEKNGMYEVSVDINEDGVEEGQNVILYVSGNGELLFFNEPVDMTEPLPVVEETEETQETGVPKTDRPVANVFVMSYCPYGLQMEKAVIPVIELLGDKADINIDYVHYIMHGKDEIDQNTRQHCIEKEQPEKFAAYLRCFVQSGDHAKCAAEAGIDTAMMDACISAEDERYNITGLYEDQSTWSNGRYPPYMVDAVLAMQYGVGGSPTFVLNGQIVSVSRSPEAVKQAICDAFTVAPEECQQTLSTAAAAAGIGAMEGGSGSEGSCE
jgi:protein-disulfide isomerase